MSESISPRSSAGAAAQTVTRVVWLAVCEAITGRRRRATEDLSASAAASLANRGRAAQPSMARHAAPEQARAGFE